MLIIGIIFMMIALILYTIAVWTEQSIKKLMVWIVLVFTFGFICDTIGTSIMFLISETKFHLTVHSVFGYGAIIIMLAHLILAILSIKKVGRCEEYFTRFSIGAWSIWMFAFITGVIIGIY